VTIPEKLLTKPAPANTNSLALEVVGVAPRFPAVLAEANETEKGLTPEPSAALDWTKAIPPLPLPAIVMLNAIVAVCELASFTCMLKLLVPATVGVPEMTPVVRSEAHTCRQTSGRNRPYIGGCAARRRKPGAVGDIQRTIWQRTRCDRKQACNDCGL
jgi:hypothetical protein